MTNYFSSPIVISNIYYCLKGFTKPGTYHYKNRNTYELGFRIRGNSISSAQGHSHKVAPNCVVFKPKGVEDTCQTDTGVEFCSIWFDIADTPTLDFHVFQPQNPQKVLECFKQLLKEEQQNGINLKCYSLLYEILYLLNYSEDYLSLSNRNLIQELTGYIEANFKNPNFSIQNILLHFELSASHLRNLFHKKFAKSPMRYLIEKRIKYAKKLLLYSEYSITEISEMSGFESPFYFSRLFKKYLGLSPSFYREQNI